MTLVAAAVTVAVIGLATYQVRRWRLSERVLAKIDRLALQPPADTTELEWAARVFWTHNIHCAVIPQVNAAYSTLREIERLLNKAIATGPSRRTLDDLWERYATMSQSGFDYRKRFESQRDQIVKAIVQEDDDYFDSDAYLSFLERVRDLETRDD